MPWVYVAKYLAGFIVVHGGKTTLVPITLLQLKVEVLFVFFKKVFDQIRRGTYLGQDSLRPTHKKCWSFVLNGDFRDYAVSWKQKFWLSRSGETSLNKCGDSFKTQKIQAVALESEWKVDLFKN